MKVERKKELEQALSPHMENVMKIMKTLDSEERLTVTGDLIMYLLNGMSVRDAIGVLELCKYSVIITMLATGSLTGEVSYVA